MLYQGYKRFYDIVDEVESQKVSKEEIEKIIYDKMKNLKVNSLTELGMLSEMKYITLKKEVAEEINILNSER
nr:MAG TPA: hypothetical protein [Caudoviricetes sp.]